MKMREIINLVEASFRPQKWWFNAETDEVIDVVRDHFDQFDAGKFGVSAATVEAINARWADDDWADEIIFWDIAYHAMLNGWVRLGSLGADGMDHAYVYAARLRHAQKALKWMMQNGHFSERVGVEIMNPEEPMLGHGEYTEIGDDRDLKRFLAKR